MYISCTYIHNSKFHVVVHTLHVHMYDTLSRAFEGEENSPAFFTNQDGKNNKIVSAPSLPTTCRVYVRICVVCMHVCMLVRGPFGLAQLIISDLF